MGSEFLNESASFTEEMKKLEAIEHEKVQTRLINSNQIQIDSNNKISEAVDFILKCLLNIQKCRTENFRR